MSITLEKPSSIGTGQVSEFSIQRIDNLETCDSEMLNQAINIYQLAFKNPPYCENFTVEEVHGVFADLAEGDFLIGKLGDRVISLTGGFLVSGGSSYYIDELAVAPMEQHKGLGSRTFKAILDLIKEKYPDISSMRLRTSESPGENQSAIGLYTNNGFASEIGPSLVAQLRINDKIEVDLRTSYSSPARTDEERLQVLNHVGIVSAIGQVTAVVFDQLLELDRKDFQTKIMNAWAKHDQTTTINQCCFVTVPKTAQAVVTVEMFSGQFCGEAVLSALKLIAKGKGGVDVPDYQGVIDVSGVVHPLKFVVVNKIIALQDPSLVLAETSGREGIPEGWISGEVEVLHNDELCLT